MSSVAVSKRIAAMDAEVSALLDESLVGMSTAERTAVTHQLEVVARRMGAVMNRFVAALAEVPVEELGEPSLGAALSTLLRISTDEANGRIHEAEDLAARVALTGEALEPVLSNTAAAQRRGLIGAEHVKIIRKFFDRLPDFVDFATREAAEAQLAELACGLRPHELRAAADRLAALLDQDGELSDADRARRRFLTVGKQGADGMSEVRGRLDPEARAMWDAVAAKWAAPGMCNPDDEHPCVDGQAAAAERQHGSAVDRSAQPRCVQGGVPGDAGLGAVG